ncbi:pentatricopeptide repeat-containing protein [Trifolium repens]|nr:pentatricopeptide repeat-containing protein [Trifolium repens]
MLKCPICVWNVMFSMCTNYESEGVYLDFSKGLNLLCIAPDQFTLINMLLMCSLKFLSFGRHAYFVVKSLGTISFSCSCVFEAYNAMNNVKNYELWYIVNIPLSKNGLLRVCLRYAKNVGCICMGYKTGDYNISSMLTFCSMEHLNYGNWLIILGSLEIKKMIQSLLCKTRPTRIEVLNALLSIVTSLMSFAFSYIELRFGITKFIESGRIMVSVAEVPIIYDCVQEHAYTFKKNGSFDSLDIIEINLQQVHDLSIALHVHIWSYFNTLSYDDYWSVWKDHHFYFNHNASLIVEVAFTFKMTARLYGFELMMVMSYGETWYFDNFFCIVNKLGCYRYMENAELVIQVYVLLSNICVTEDLWAKAKLAIGTSMLVHVYNSLAWELCVASLCASFHHLTIKFLLISRHTKLLIVLHRKMIYNGSFYAPNVSIMWKNWFSKRGSYSNISLGTAPMIIMHFNCRSLNWFFKIFNTMVNSDTNHWRVIMSPYLKVNYFKDVCSLESIPICLGITTCQATYFAVVLKFECQKYSVVAVLHRKVLLRGQLLLLQFLEIFKFDHENVSGSLNCKSIYIMLAIAVYVNRGSVLVTKIMLKWMDLPPKHATLKFAANVEAILHRKMVERKSVHVPLILLKWKTLPPKHGT